MLDTFGCPKKIVPDSYLTMTKLQQMGIDKQGLTYDMICKVAPLKGKYP